MHEPTQSVINDLLIRDNLLFIAMGDYRLEIYDVESFTRVHTITFQSEVRCIAANDQYLFVGILQEEIQIFTITEYKFIKTIDHSLGVTKLHVDTQYLYSIGFNNVMHIFDIDKLEEIHRVEVEYPRIHTVSSVNGHFITGDGSRTVSALRFWSKNNFQQVKKIDIEAGRIVRAVIHNESMIVGTGNPAQILIWNCVELKPLARKIGYKSDIRGIVANSRYLFVASADRIYIYDPINYEFQNSILESESEISSMLTYNDYLIYGCRSTVIVRDTRTLKIIKKIELI